MWSKRNDPRPVKRQDFLPVHEIAAELDFPLWEREEQWVRQQSYYGFALGELVRCEIVTEIADHHPKMMLMLPRPSTLDDGDVG